MKIETTITIKLKDKDLRLSLDEAQELYEHLSKLLSPKETEYIPYYPAYPTTDPLKPMWYREITSGDHIPNNDIHVYCQNESKRTSITDQ